MSGVKKVILPVAAKEGRPTTTAARSRLGGRATSDATLPAGVVVAIGGDGDGGDGVPMVVIHASGDEVYLLSGDDRVKRVRRADVGEPLSDRRAGVTEDLARRAAEARVFGALAEGDDVRYEDDAGELARGRLVEKCRWGALVVRDDGVVVAVGYRKLWPAASKADVQ